MKTPTPEADGSPMLPQIVRLTAAFVCMHACMTGLRMAAPLFALEKGHSAAAVGFLMALFALVQVFMALPAGRFVDRRGFRIPVRWSVGTAVLGTGLAAMFPVFPVLCASALLAGGAAGFSSIAIQRHGARLARNPGEMRRVFSWLAIGPAVANFVGPFIAGLTIDHAGFRTAFLVAALMPLGALYWTRRVHDLPPMETAHARRGHNTWDLWRDRNLRKLLLVNWFLSACWDVHTFVVPVLGHERGFSASAIGTILGAFAIAAALIRVVLPIVAARTAEWAMIAGAMLATAVLCGVYPLMPAAWAMGICSVLLGFALGSVQPMVMSLLHQITPPHRQGEAVAMRVMVINASSVLMPLVFGVAGAAVGVSAVFWIAGLAVGAGSRVAFRLRGALGDEAVKDDRTSG